MLAAMAWWHEHTLLAFDLETTGVDPFTDVPVSYALVALQDGVVVGSDAWLIDPGREIPAGASAVHGISTERARREGMTLGFAVRRIADALVDASGRGVPVVGMKLDYDLTMLDRCYRRETGRGLVDAGFCGPVVDALVIDRHVDRFRPGKRTLRHLCAFYGVELEDAHDAAADATAAARVVRALCERYPELRASSPAELHASQSEWHREWVRSFREWRGLGPLPDSCWPIAADGRGTGARTAV